MPRKKFVRLAICALIAIVSIMANETLTHLGDTYWFGLWALAAIHLAASAVALVASPRNSRFDFVIVGLLIAGQWRVLEAITMLTIWSVRSFAP